MHVNKAIQISRMKTAGLVFNTKIILNSLLLRSYSTIHILNDTGVGAK